MATYTRKNEDTSPKVNPRAMLEDTESLIAPVAGENEQLAAYAKELAFMAEPVEVMILPNHDQDDTTRLVSISVNGKSFHFLRGEWRTCPRYVLEVLATAKHQAWNFGYTQARNGVTVQTQNDSFVLRYPHQYRDKNPKGVAWYDAVKNRVI